MFSKNFQYRVNNTITEQNVNDIIDLLDCYDKYHLSNLSYQEQHLSISIKNMGSQHIQDATMVNETERYSTDKSNTVEEHVHSSSQEQNNSSIVDVKSTITGTFFSKMNPDADDFVKIGDQVSQTSVLCLLEAMKMFVELNSPVDGIVQHIYVKNGDLVQEGDILFSVQPS